MKKFIASLCILSFVVMNTFAFVPLTNQQLNLGSFRAWATCGMFYDELDIISAHPVSLLEYTGNSLYTTWGNVRNSVDVSYNPIITYNRAAMNSPDNTFVLGIAGDPLKNFGIKNSRMGFVFQNFGSKAVWFDLDNNTSTGFNPGLGGGWDSEGKWQDIDSQDTGGDYQFDYQEIYEANLKYYDNQSINQYNVGFAIKGLLPMVDTLGVSVARQSNYTTRLTGGTKSYKERALNDNGLPAGWPSGTRILNTYELTYAENNSLINSFDQTDLLAQGRIQDLIPGLRLDVGIGLRIRNDYNPNGLVKTAHTITKSTAKLNNANNAVLYDTGEAIRDVVNYDGGLVTELDYGDFTNLLTHFQAGQIWTPAWVGVSGKNLPGLFDFSDDRKGLGALIRAEAEYNLFNIPTIAVLNLSMVPQKLDSKQTFRDYIKTRTYDTTQANDPLDTWVARDYTQKIEATGDIINTTIDFGLKFDFVRAEYLNVSFGGFITSQYQLADYKTKTNSTEITSYDDGVSGDNPFVGARPSPTNGEGIWTQTIQSEATNKDETTTLTISVPVGAEIPITKKWTFRAGTVYNMTTTKQVKKQTAGITTTVTSVTPAGGATNITTTITDPAAYLNESTYYEETHSVTYTYGIEWRPNKNLILACNAFLDMNENPGTAPTDGKATIFDLDTYRLLAIQAIFKF